MIRFRRGREQASNGVGTVNRASKAAAASILRMMLSKAIAILLAASAICHPQTRKRRVLALGDTSTRTYQHVSISHALATVERLGRESGLYDTWIRTDPQLITKKRSPGHVRNLDDFDAIFFFSIGELAMTAEQKADLLSFF